MMSICAWFAGYLLLQQPVCACGKRTAPIQLCCDKALKVLLAAAAAAAAVSTAHRRIALLAAGDLAVLLAFAAVGRVNHGEPLTVSDTLTTALPFIVGE
jgi:hypothetical protein